MLSAADNVLRVLRHHNMAMVGKRYAAVRSCPQECAELAEGH
jgi:hypothetical protein